MKFHKIWVQQCRATCRIKRQFGVKSALDYLLGEKLVNFAEAADQRPEFFSPYELAGYLITLKPSHRKKLQKLPYVQDSPTFRRLA